PCLPHRPAAQRRRPPVDYRTHVRGKDRHHDSGQEGTGRTDRGQRRTVGHGTEQRRTAGSGALVTSVCLLPDRPACFYWGLITCHRREVVAWQGSLRVISCRLTLSYDPAQTPIYVQTNQMNASAKAMAAGHHNS